MNKGKKSRKLLFVATVLTIVALATVLLVYAVTLVTFTGGNVTVVGVASGTIEYATTNTGSPTWTTTLQPTGSWYAELVLGSNSAYKGAVTITWQLQTDATGSWVDVGSPIVTSGISLTGGSQTIYASTDGLLTDAFDWSAIATGGTYQITAVVASA